MASGAEGIGEVRRESTVKDFLEVVFRRKWVIAGIVAVAVVVTVIMTLRQPAMYESTAKMLVRRGEAPGVFDGSIRTLTWEEEISSQIEMIKSQVVVDAARKLLPRFLGDDPRVSQPIVLGRVNAGVVSTSNVIWVTYNSGDPRFCKAAVDAIVTAYKEYYSDIRTPPAMEDFFAQEIGRLQDEIEFWRTRKETLLQEWDIVDLTIQRRNLLDRLSVYESNLNTAILDRVRLETVIASLERLRASTVEELAAASSGLTDSQIEAAVISNLRVKIHALAMQESELAAKFTDRNPELLRVRSQIEDVHAMLSKEVDTQILMNRMQLGVLAEREGTIRGLVGELAAQREAYPRKEVELERVQSTLAKLQSTYEDVVDQHMSARIKVASNPEWTITILNPASDAYRKKTRDYVRMALGPIFSLVVALGLAFFVDNLDHSIKSIAEAEETLGLPVLANFPETMRK
jgi:uncharacterized protein involved in exopolysaccharide biosynthesis